MLLGRDQDARRLFERLLALRNDVGLLSEEYDLQAQRLVGNFPQALSHIGLVTTALDIPGEKALYHHIVLGGRVATHHDCDDVA
jgi:hypothetical protein